MAFNINNMIKQGLQGGVAKTSHFEVLITPPNGLSTDFTRNLMYRADSVEIPGRTSLTIDHKFTNNGPMNKLPYSNIYPDVTITFILSDNFAEKTFFDTWQSLMLDVQPGNFGEFNVKYFDSYKGLVQIRQFSQTGTLQTTTTLHDAYPIIINGVQMGWQDDSIARISVQMAHRYYTVESSNDKPEKNEVPVETPQQRTNVFR